MFVPLILATLVAADAKADFTHVPDDAVVVARLEAAELYRSPAVDLVRLLIDKAGTSARKAFDRRFVPAPSSVQRVWLVARRPVNPSDGESVFLVQTDTAFDAKAALTNLMPQGVRRKIGDRVYVVQPGRFALSILDETTFVVGPEALVASYLGAPRTGASPAVAAWGQTTHAACWIWWTNAVVMKELLRSRGEVPERSKPFFPVFHAKSGVVTLDLSRNLNDATFEMRLLYADEAEAEVAEEAAKKGLVLAREHLREMIAKLEKETLAAPAAEENSIRPLKLFVGAYSTGTLRGYDKLLATMPLHRDGASLATSGSMTHLYSLMAHLAVLGQQAGPVRSTTTNVIEPRPAPKPE